MELKGDYKGYQIRYDGTMGMFDVYATGTDNDSTRISDNSGFRTIEDAMRFVDKFVKVKYVPVDILAKSYMSESYKPATATALVGNFEVWATFKNERKSRRKLSMGSCLLDCKANRQILEDIDKLQTETVEKVEQLKKSLIDLTSSMMIEEKQKAKGE